MLVISVILVAVDHDLVADFPSLNFVTYSPNDAGRIRACDVKRLAMPCLLYTSDAADE